MNTKKLCTTAIIGTLYAVLTVAVSPISYGLVQFRLSEALCVLPIFFPESVIGLTIGCFIANIFGNSVLDLIFGTSATLIASLLSYLLGKNLSFTKKLVLCQALTTIFNALLVPITFLPFVEIKNVYFVGMLTVLVGEVVVLSTLGTILAVGVKKYFKNYLE